MGSPLGPVLADTFMIELEQNIITTLSKDVSLWKRYVDDTICFVNSNCISHVLELLNSFHSNIKFTTEIEIENKIAFSDILLIRNKDLVNTTARKQILIYTLTGNLFLQTIENGKHLKLKGV